MRFLLKRFIYGLIKLRSAVFLPFVAAYILLVSYIAYWIEPQTFGSYFNSIYWVMTTLATVGFGDYSPVTTLGKAFTIFLYITGVGLISLFLGNVIESFYMIEKNRVGGKMKYEGKNHVILIGWSGKARAAVQEILKSEADVDVVLIDNMEASPVLEDRFFYIRGDAADEQTLMRANLTKCKGVIIFAEEIIQPAYGEKDPLLADGKTLLIATAITSLEERLGIPIHVTAEVLNQHHIPLFRQVKVDEFIPTREMVSHAAVRSLFSHGVTLMYSEMMSSQHGENMYELPKKAAWNTYRDAFLDLLDQGATLMADRGDLYINQKLNEPIPEDALLFVVCDKETLAKIKASYRT